MRDVQIYIEGKRLELFNDEKIEINSSVQNIQDIAKVFTDFSQSFTVPASTINNQIFQHFYQSDVNATIDHQIRRDAKIEIDLTNFRTGKIQIEKSNLKNGSVESYTLTFYGDIVTLFDLIGDEKMNTLDLSAYSHLYTGSEVQSRVTSTADLDVRYPLVSSLRQWQNSGGGVNDITQTAHAIAYTELFPAIKISRLFQAIETKYDIDFQGLFLTDKRFTECFMHLKNKETFKFRTAFQRVDFATTSPTPNSYFDLVEDSLHVEYIDPTIALMDEDTEYHSISVSIPYVSNSAITYYIDVYENGVYQTTVTKNGTGNEIILDYNNEPGLDKKITLNVSSDFPLTIRINLIYQQTYYTNDSYGNPSVTQQRLFFGYGINQSLIGTVDLSAVMPDMKIADFITGILKKFNLTCYGLTPYTFQVEPLEDWYKKGRILNITPYTDIDSVDIERIKVYKEISFAHEVSQSVTNVEFYDTFGRQYGDLQQSYNYESSEYQVKVPFENLLFNKFTGTNLQVGYYLDKSLVPYIPKPSLMYIEEAKTCSFKFDNGSTVPTLTSYRPFGQDLTYNNFKWSLNFGADISTLYNVVNPNSIYSVYYSGYLNNLYARKNRMYTYKTKLPISILTSLKLNDRLIIRDKRYIINEMKSELTSGDVTFVLILDFRAMNAITTSPVPKPSGTITVPILIGNQVTKITIDVGTTGVTADKYIVTTDDKVLFTYPENTSDFFLIATEDSDVITTEELIALRSEQGGGKVYPITLTTEYENGDLDYSTLYIIQE
jgi:hypothetical protein